MRRGHDGYARAQWRGRELEKSGYRSVARFDETVNLHS
jgi:hypothetical protein